MRGSEPFKTTQPDAGASGHSSTNGTNCRSSTKGKSWPLRRLDRRVSNKRDGEYVLSETKTYQSARSLRSTTNPMLLQPVENDYNNKGQLTQWRKPFEAFKPSSLCEVLHDGAPGGLRTRVLKGGGDHPEGVAHRYPSPLIRQLDEHQAGTVCGEEAARSFHDFSRVERVALTKHRIGCCCCCCCCGNKLLFAFKTTAIEKVRGYGPTQHIGGLYIRSTNRSLEV